MSGGFFAVHRSIWDHPGFAREKYSELQAWLWLISSAAWEPRRARIGRATFDLERGQCVFALRFLAAKWRWSEARVRRFLDRRAADGAMVVLATRAATLITICNYDNYQSSRRADVAEIDAPSSEESTADRRKEKETTTKNNKTTLSSDVIEVFEEKPFPTSSLLPPDWVPTERLCEEVKQAFGMTDADLASEVPAFHALNVSNGTLSQDWSATFRLFCKRWKEHREKQAPPRVQLNRMPGFSDRFVPGPADWDKAAEFYAKTGRWPREHGPDPMSTGCKCPVETLRKHGINEAGDRRALA